MSKPSDFELPAELAANWLTLKQAEKRLSISKWAINSLVRDELLVKSMYHRRVIISKASIDAYLAKFRPVAGGLA